MARFDIATRDDDEAVRRLLRENPMDGAVRLSLEREPDSALAAAVEGDVHHTVAARSERTGRLIGIGTRSVTTAYVNGEACRVGYLGQLRVDRTQPARLRLLRGGYAELGALRSEGASVVDFTTIVEDNRPARRMLEAGLRGLPRYQAIDTIVTLAIPSDRRVRRGGADPEVSRGSDETCEGVVGCLQRNGRRHQLARRWTAEDLRSESRTRDLDLGDFWIRVRDGGVVGCLALWDQRGFKQSVVRGYAPWLTRTRPLLNALAPVMRRPSPQSTQERRTRPAS